MKIQFDLLALVGDNFSQRFASRLNVPATLDILEDIGSCWYVKGKKDLSDP